jgi:hybrid cluster-associated redox disulfide protein
MKPSPISLELVVADLLKAWPQTIPVFLSYRLGCVGCCMSSFDTLSDVARIYNLPADRFLKEIEKAIQSEPENL